MEAPKKRKASTSSHTSMESPPQPPPCAENSHRKRSVGSSPESSARLPSKKRKGSQDGSANTASVFFDEEVIKKQRAGSHDSNTSQQHAKDGSSMSPTDLLRRRKGSDQTTPSRNTTDSAAAAASAGGSSSTLRPLPVAGAAAATTSALEHLDALGATATTAAAAKQPRKDSNTDETASSLASSGQRLLLEAIMMASGSGSHEGAEGTASAPPAAGAGNPTKGAAAAGADSKDSKQPAANVATAAAAAAAAAAETFSGRRDRLESWGGMSDLSAPLEAVLHHTVVGEEQQKAGGAVSNIPSRISLNRDRLNSVASFGENPQQQQSRERLNSVASALSEASAVLPANVASSGAAAAAGEEIQAFVAAAMASVGDQLAELAGAVESAALLDAPVESEENSSTLSPMIGALSENPGRRGSRSSRNRPRSGSTVSSGGGRLSVDFDAVAAAVDAAAATGTLEMSTAAAASAAAADSSSKNNPKKRSVRRQLPLSRKRSGGSDCSEGSSEEKPVHAPVSLKKTGKKRARVRNSKGSKKSPPTKSLPPIKKRAKRNSPEPNDFQSPSSLPTPRVSNKNKRPVDPSTKLPAPLVVVSSSDPETNNKVSKGQAELKWDAMFECLEGFVDERRKEQCQGMTEEEKAEWEWDGNVPTTFKTKDGKALGRWVNNQRSAKNKGTLKEEREQRLLDVGLKWSVLASSTWGDMLEELRYYVQELKKQGKTWNGNVPTSYQIKPRKGRVFRGEDKNLGRWVNRQRSLFQSGKLLKERQVSLEKLGLKWQILTTTTWDSMHQTLLKYVEGKKTEVGTWDGNVPATYRTDDDPPRALGRWINRQRTSYVKGKLKKEYIDKLNACGLKWSVHERNLARPQPENSSQAKDENNDSEDVKPDVVTSI